METPKYTFKLGKSHVVVTLRKAQLIPSLPQDIFSVKVATRNAVKVTFKENKNELKHKSDKKIKIHVYNRLYNLMRIRIQMTVVEDVMISTRGIKYWIIATTTTPLNYLTWLMQQKLRNQHERKIFPK